VIESDAGQALSQCGNESFRLVSGENRIQEIPPE
jgi:hypothetical protein